MREGWLPHKHRAALENTHYVYYYYVQKSAADVHDVALIILCIQLPSLKDSTGQ